MIKTMKAKYSGTCAATGAAIRPGDAIEYNTATKRARLTNAGRVDVLTFVGEHGPNTFTRNVRGRCEDAPCCGCCTI